jgi:hypothetical protein
MGAQELVVGMLPQEILSTTRRWVLARPGPMRREINKHEMKMEYKEK